MAEIWILSEAGKDDVGNNRYVGVEKRKYKSWRGHWVIEWHKCEFVTAVQPGVDCLRISSENYSHRWVGLEYLRKNNWIPKWMRKNK